MTTSSHSEKIPVAYFIYNRPDKVRESFRSIRDYRPEKLFVFADGPKASKAGDLEQVEAARLAMGEVDWECEAVLVFRDENQGLRASIMEGLDSVFSNVEFAIVVEDDCLLHPDFFHLCEELGPKFSNHPNVGLVSASSFHSKLKVKESYIFSRQPSIWGWATWASTWKGFRATPQVQSWSARQIEDVVSTCCTRGQRHRWELDMKRAASLETWDISFGVYLRLMSLLTVVPTENLCQNFGFGKDATHTKRELDGILPPVGTLLLPITHPSKVTARCEYDILAERQSRQRILLGLLLRPLRHLRQCIRII